MSQIMLSEFLISWEFSAKQGGDLMLRSVKPRVHRQISDSLGSAWGLPGLHLPWRPHGTGDQSLSGTCKVHALITVASRSP